MVEKSSGQNGPCKSFRVWVREEAEFVREVDEVMPLKVLVLQKSWFWGLDIELRFSEGQN